MICPRCGAPLAIQGKYVVCSTEPKCYYGADAPRELVPQPDPPTPDARSNGVPSPRELTILAVLMQHLRSKSPAFVAWEIDRALGALAPVTVGVLGMSVIGDELIRKLLHEERLRLLLADPAYHACAIAQIESVAAHLDKIEKSMPAQTAPTPQRTDVKNVCETTHQACRLNPVVCDDIDGNTYWMKSLFDITHDDIAFAPGSVRRYNEKTRAWDQIDMATREVVAQPAPTPAANAKLSAEARKTILRAITRWEDAAEDTMGEEIVIRKCAAVRAELEKLP